MLVKLTPGLHKLTILKLVKLFTILTYDCDSKKLSLDVELDFEPHHPEPVVMRWTMHCQVVLAQQVRRYLVVGFVV